MIAIFDSGVGGLSVLRHIQAQLPQHALCYFADSGYAPYGDKSDEQVRTRSLQVVAHLLREHDVEALVIACNTATAAAVREIRASDPSLPVVGIEPGLKPALAIASREKIGVLATQSTLNSEKYRQLAARLEQESGKRFIGQACVGLVEHIERGELQHPATRALLEKYLLPLFAQNIDTLVLGCTHYPFVSNVIDEIAQDHGILCLKLIDTGEAVTRQLQRLLPATRIVTERRPLQIQTTGSAEQMRTVCGKLLGLGDCVDIRAVKVGCEMH